MKELKFRVWNPDDLKMEYPIVFSFIDGIMKALIKCEGGNAYKDYPIMQFTGLKDKKGVDVYEGDIVKMDDNLEQFKGTELYDRESVSHHEIYYDNSRAMFTDIRLEDGDSLAGYLDGDISFVCDGEVAGNIYSNLEFKRWFD